MSFTRGGYKYTSLLASWIGGVLEYKVFFGSVNEDRFNDFIVNDLLVHLNAYPGKCSILFVDNVAFHHNPFFINVIKFIGCILTFLPHHNPIMTLTEWVFRDVKAIEIKKKIYGEYEGLVSLCESVEGVKNEDYEDILQEIGYF